MRPVHLVPAAVVLLALGALASAAEYAWPAATSASHAAMATRQVAITSAVRACPPAQGGGSGTVALIAGSPASSGSPSSGQAELAPLPLAGLQLRTVSPISQADPGVLSMLTVPAASSATKKGTSVPEGWSVTASGVMAQAMEAEEAQGSGPASVRCGEPGSDIWFVGPGQQNGASHIQLDLMNMDALTANVDVSVITDAGPVQADDDTGIVVPSHQTVTESLSSMAGGSSVVAIEVRTTIGRVAADVVESSGSGSTSWLPSTAAPSTKLVIPGVPSSSSAAGLFIVVPGDSSALVNVLAITPQGQYRPFGTQTVDLPGESASYVALTPLGGTASALELTANVPVTAAVLVPGSGLGAFTAATAPISEQAVVAGNTSGSGTAATIVLSAPAGAARVRLTEITAPASGAGAKGGRATGPGSAMSQVVSVRAGHTVVVPAAAPRGSKSGSAFAIVITPLAGSGPLYAARVETQGQSTVVSIIPAVSALATLSLPPVRDSYTAISP
jgi:Family of unknown function (DUF5719)